MSKFKKNQEENESILAVAGSSGLKRYGGIVDEEWHQHLAGLKAARIYREMKDNDPIAGGILWAIEMLIRQVDWRIEPKEKTPECEYWADYAESCRTDMETTWQMHLSEVLDMLPYGWSLFEQTYKIRRGRSSIPYLNSTQNDGMVGLRDLSVRAQDTLDKWEFGPGGEILGFHQFAPPVYKHVFIPGCKLALFRVVSRKNNPEGRSIFRTAYRPWYFLKRIQEIEAIGIERDLAGLPVMELPAQIMASNASDAQKTIRTSYETMVKKIRRDHYEGVVIPSERDQDDKPTGYRLRLLSSGGRRPIDVNEIVKRYESRIAISVLSEFLLLGMDKVGSFALADNKTDLFAVALGSIMDSVCDVWNRVILPRLMEVNGAPEGCTPKLVHGDVETPSLTEFVQGIAAATGAGLITATPELEDFMREKMKLPPRSLTENDPGAPPVEPPAPAPELVIPPPTGYPDVPPEEQPPIGYLPDVGPSENVDGPYEDLEEEEPGL